MDTENERYYMAINNLDSIQKIRDLKTLYIGKLGKILTKFPYQELSPEPQK